MCVDFERSVESGKLKNLEYLGSSNVKGVLIAWSMSLLGLILFLPREAGGSIGMSSGSK